MSDEDSAGLSMGLQPCCQIHFVANDRVVQPVLTAEIADGAETRVDPDPRLFSNDASDRQYHWLVLPSSAMKNE